MVSLLDFIGFEGYQPAVYIAFIATCILSTFTVILYRILYSRTQTAEPEACRKFGLKGPSNLTDEHDERYSGSLQQDGDTTWRVKSLWTYPVKSCTGVELDAATIRGIGLEYDRQFCFAQLTSKFPAGVSESMQEKDKHKWKFITQRSIPAMARIKTEIWFPDPTSPAYSQEHPNSQSQGVLVIRFPSITQDSGLLSKAWGRLTMGANAERTVHIPLNPNQEQTSTNGYATEDMEIWKDSPPSLLMATTENADPWIQDLRFYLGITNHLGLFRLSMQPREVYRCAPRKGELGYQPVVGFQDAYPLHILNLASVHDVARNMKSGAPPLGARNFRPNIVIAGGKAYAEDSWKRINIGDFDYHVACRTVRCLLPNVNPATGVRHGSEPNRTLKSFRRIDEGDPKNACLGMQMVPAIEYNKIAIGDAITVLETGEHLYLPQ